MPRRRIAVAFPEHRHCPDLAAVFIARPDRESTETVARAIEAQRLLPLPKANMTDPVGVRLPPRIAAALKALLQAVRHPDTVTLRAKCTLTLGRKMYDGKVGG